MNKLELVKKELEALKRFLRRNRYIIASCDSHVECYQGIKATNVLKEQLEVYTTHKVLIEKKVSFIDLVIKHVTRDVEKRDLGEQYKHVIDQKFAIRNVADDSIERIQESIKYDLSNPTIKGVDNMMGELSDKILNDDMGDTPKEVIDYYNELVGNKVTLKQLATLIKESTLKDMPIVQEFYKTFFIYPMSLSTYILQFGLILGSDQFYGSSASNVQDKFIKLANNKVSEL